MVLIFNSTVSCEISGTNFTPTRAITYTYIIFFKIKMSTADTACVTKFQYLSLGFIILQVLTHQELSDIKQQFQEY